MVRIETQRLIPELAAIKDSTAGLDADKKAVELAGGQIKAF